MSDTGAPLPPRPVVRWKTCIVLAVVIGALMFLYMDVSVRSHMKQRENEAVRGMLKGMVTALEVYRSRFGAYPGIPGRPLVADTRRFIAGLRSLGPAALPFMDEDLFDGKCRSHHDKPFFYTHPAAGVPGPDGTAHPGVDYYLWTWGNASEGPEAEWEINNWEGR
jgi:hypothetical protein